MKKVLIDENKNFMPGAEEMDIIPKTLRRYTLVPKANAQAQELQRLVAAALLNCTPAMVTKHHKQALFNLRRKVG